MFKKVMLLAALSIVAALAVVSTAAASGGGGVTKQGVCTGSSTSTLKVKNDNGGLEVEWEVDSNVVGQNWAWKIKDNGTVQAKGRATTQAPSGSFEIRRILTNQAGTDRVVATASNPDTGESCRAAISF